MPSKKTSKPEVVSSIQTKNFSTFGMRIVASVIDGIIVKIVTSVFFKIFAPNAEASGMMEYGYERHGPGNGTLLLVLLVYCGFMECSQYQGSLGKMAVGLKVTDEHGNRLTTQTAVIRNAAKILSVVTLGVGFLMAAFTEKKQALHDILAKTLVVKK